jgi:two-component system chemotaxis response regulator CheY
LLTGHYVHDGETVLEKILAHREQPARPISEIRKDVPPSLDATFLKMVARNLPDRHQSMTEVLRDLDACEIPDQPVEFVPGFAPTSVALAATSDGSTPGITISELSVLIVEPSRTQSTVMATLLNKLGTRRVQAVKSGDEAVAAFRTSKHDLVISALHLPDMTGIDLLNQMRGPTGLSLASFILVSSEGDCATLESLGSQARVAVLPKPFDAPLLSWAMTVAVEGLITQSMMLPKINVSNARVLLVDDSVVARAHVRKALENAGLRQITEATNGRQARDLLETNTFDLVVTDFNMPEMDGEALLRYIRWQSSQRSIPVIVVTTETDEERRAAVRHLGVSALSGKNLDPKLVRAALVGSMAL